MNHHSRKSDNEGCASALLLVAGIILGLACLFAVVHSGGGR